jgi:hypothetical protein
VFTGDAFDVIPILGDILCDAGMQGDRDKAQN